MQWRTSEGGAKPSAAIKTFQWVRRSWGLFEERCKDGEDFCLWCWCKPVSFYWAWPYCFLRCRCQTELTAFAGSDRPFMKGVKKQVNSGFGKPHCCRMREEDGAGKPPHAAACSSSLSGCLRFLHLYALMGKNMLNIIPVIEPLLSAGNWGYV